MVSFGATSSIDETVSFGPRDSNDRTIAFGPATSNDTTVFLAQPAEMTHLSYLDPTGTNDTTVSFW